MTPTIRASPRLNLAVAFHVTASSEWLAHALRILGRVYRFVPAEQVERYLHDGAPLRGAAFVTFDDGDRSFYELAFPVLRALGIPANIYVSPRVIEEGTNYWFQDWEHIRAAGGEDKLRAAACEHLGVTIDSTLTRSVGSLLKLLPVATLIDIVRTVGRSVAPQTRGRLNMSVKELREVHASGLVTIGAHTLHHPILLNETDECAAHEIQGSVSELSALLSAPVTTFAYPNGQPGLDFSVREQRLLTAAGVRLAVSTDQGPFGRRSDPLAIPRLNLEGHSRDTTFRIIAKAAAVATGRVNPQPLETRERRELLASGMGSRAPTAAAGTRYDCLP